MKKNNNVLVGLVILLVIVIVGWAISSSPSTPESSVTTPTNSNGTKVTNVKSKTATPTPKTALQNTNTFPAIFTQSGSHECDFEQVGPSARSSNIVYIADGKMRGEFRTISAGLSTASMMVYNSGVLYVWTEGMGVGTKTILKSVSDLPAIIPVDLTSGSVLGSGLNSIGWNCHDWAKSTSMLAPPSYVKF
jgi:hypothetical protein